MITFGAPVFLVSGALALPAVTPGLDSNGVLGGEFMPAFAVCLRALGKTRVSPAFGGHVLHVVGLRSEKEMGGIHASRIIAGVADVRHRRNRAVSDLPGNAVGEGRVPSPVNPTVSVHISSSHPHPTTRSNQNFRPEPFFESLFHATKLSTIVHESHERNERGEIVRSRVIPAGTMDMMQQPEMVQ